MDSRHIALLVEYGIMFLAGIYITALGHRWLGKPPAASPAYDAWHGKYGKSMKWLGPAISAFAVVLYVLARVKP